MNRPYPKIQSGAIVTVIFLLTLSSCHLKYDSDELDLSFYQWNKWTDTLSFSAESGKVSPPSAGWDRFNRGMGELVRIPSRVSSGEGITWFHCRFTLPEEWSERPVELKLEGIQPGVAIYLNEEYVGSFQWPGEPIVIKITGIVYYTLDNHLALGVFIPPGETAPEETGITGKAWIISYPVEGGDQK